MSDTSLQEAEVPRSFILNAGTRCTDERNTRSLGNSVVEIHSFKQKGDVIW